ncbi:hypothetical protein TNCV_2473721, partial [Trichonephila clavipes]
SLWQPSRPSSWQGANPVGTNPWAQQTSRLSLPVFYAQSSDISVPRFQPPTQLSSSGPIRFSSSRGSRPRYMHDPPSVHSEDSGLGSSSRRQHRLLYILQIVVLDRGHRQRLLTRLIMKIKKKLTEKELYY